MGEDAPAPGTVRIVGRPTAHETKIEVFTPEGGWIPLRGVASYRVEVRGAGGRRPLVVLEFEPLCLGAVDFLYPRDLVGLRVLGVTDEMLAAAKDRVEAMRREDAPG